MAGKALNKNILVERSIQTRGNIIAKLKEENDAAFAQMREEGYDLKKPRTRAECGKQRPCPWISCKYHLYLDVNPQRGRITINYPNIPPWEMENSCVLDLIETSRGEMISKKIGEKALNMSRQAVCIIVLNGIRKIKRNKKALKDFI